MSRRISKQKSDNLRALAEAILIWIFDEQDRAKIGKGKLVELRIAFGERGGVDLKALYFKDDVIKEHFAHPTCKWSILQTLLQEGDYRYFSDTDLYKGYVSFSRDPTPTDIKRALEVLNRYQHIRKVPPYGRAYYEFRLEISLPQLTGTFGDTFDTEEEAHAYVGKLKKRIARGEAYIDWEFPDANEMAKSAKLVEIVKE